MLQWKTSKIRINKKIKEKEKKTSAVMENIAINFLLIKFVNRYRSLAPEPHKMPCHIFLK